MPAKVKTTSGIPFSKEGAPVGCTLDETFSAIDKKLSEIYWVDFTKVSELLGSGELNLDELTDDVLRSAEFKLEPNFGFKSKPSAAGFSPTSSTQVLP
ncbi:MAG: hypothetical protein LBH84_02325 [Prevotellaceae bacterium]|nr:hypothetical protein [Prevotellaceae bacterium]